MVYRLCLVALIVWYCTGCCTTKTCLTMNKTIDLDKRAMDGITCGVSVEIFRNWSKREQ